MSKNQKTKQAPVVDPVAPKPEGTAPELENSTPEPTAGDTTAPKPEGTAPELENSTPEPTVDETTAPKPEKTAPAPDKPKKPKKETGVPEYLTPYIKAYPACRVFHTTTDRMVFLEGDRNAALMHQRSLGSGAVETFKVR